MIAITKFRAVAKHTLVGFFDATLTNVQLSIRDIALHRFDERYWISLPARPMFAADGTPIINARTGKQDYFAFLRFTTRSAHDSFERQALAALRQTHPEAFSLEAEDVA
jgi:hypothetical protein